jgi:hypothetical protein
LGSSEREGRRILHDLATYEPRLCAGITGEIDTIAPLDEVVDALESIAGRSVPSARPGPLCRPATDGSAGGQYPPLSGFGTDFGPGVPSFIGWSRIRVRTLR